MSPAAIIVIPADAAGELKRSLTLSWLKWYFVKIDELPIESRV